MRQINMHTSLPVSELRNITIASKISARSSLLLIFTCWFAPVFLKLFSPSFVEMTMFQNYIYPASYIIQV